MSSFISSGKVSKLFMMLSCLPLPPLPVKFTIQVEEVQDADNRQALSVAMNSLEGHGRDDTKVHSSHAILAALTMFADWCEFGKQNAQPSKIVKDGLVLKLMKACLEAGNGEESCSVSEEKAYEIFSTSPGIGSCAVFQPTPSAKSSLNLHSNPDTSPSCMLQ